MGDAALGGAERGCFGYVWVQILVWVGLGWVRWPEKWEVKETREWVGVRGSGGFVEVGERKALEGSGNGGYHVVCLFVCLTLALFRSVFGRGELCLIIGSGV